MVFHKYGGAQGGFLARVSDRFYSGIPPNHAGSMKANCNLKFIHIEPM